MDSNPTVARQQRIHIARVLGLKNSQGDYVAAICLNMDVSLLAAVTAGLGQLMRIDVAAPPVPDLGAFAQVRPPLLLLPPPPPPPAGAANALTLVRLLIILLLLVK